MITLLHSNYISGSAILPIGAAALANTKMSALAAFCTKNAE